MNRLVNILLLALFLAGCATGTAPHASTSAGNQAGAPAVTKAATPAAAPAVAPVATPAAPSASSAPTSADGWNDQALRLIKQGDWAEAVTAAKQALALNPNSAAGWFNLGRAYLGAGQAIQASDALEKAHELSHAASSDVEYFLGQAQAAIRDFVAARGTYERALKAWPADREIGQALRELMATHDTESVLGGRVDVDGDGTVDVITVAQGEVRVVGGSTGKQLYVEHSPFAESTPPNALVEAYPLRGQTPLIRVTWSTCPRGFNTFFWFDRRQGAFRQTDGGGLCLSVRYLGDGRFEFMSPGGNAMLVNTRQWAGDHWVDEGMEERPLGK